MYHEFQEYEVKPLDKTLLLLIDNKDSETVSTLCRSKSIFSSFFLSITHLLWIQLCPAGSSPAFALTAGSRSVSYSVEYGDYNDHSDDEDEEEYESGDYEN